MLKKTLFILIILTITMSSYGYYESSEGTLEIFSPDGTKKTSIYRDNIDSYFKVNTGILYFQAADISFDSANAMYWDDVNNILTVPTVSTGLTAGSVVFSDGSNLAEDNANLFWDDTNDILIVEDISITTPSNIYSLSHDSFADFVANEHIDWTNAIDDFLTTALGTFGNLDVDTLNLNGNVISDSTGEISFSNETLSTTSKMGIGVVAASIGGRQLFVETPKHALNTTGEQMAFGARGRAQNTANSSAALYGFNGGIQFFGSYNYTGQNAALLAKVEHVGTGTINVAMGMQGRVVNYNTLAGTITNARVFSASLDAEDGTIVNAVNFFGNAAAVDTGTLTTFAHIWLEDSTSAATNYGIVIDSDNLGLTLGAGQDSSIIDDGTDLILNADEQSVGGRYVILKAAKTTTGDPAGEEGMIYWNTVDNVIKMYADGNWRTLASW